MKQYLMGIDNGGSEIKCAIFGMDGEEIAVAGRRLPISVPAPGFTERDALQVWEANAEAIRESIEKAGISGKQIKAVGLTGYGNGLCLVDGKGEPTCSCIVSTDNRAADYCRRFAENGAERAIYPMTCQTIWSAQPAALLPWFKDNRPEVLEKSAWYLSIKDFIRFRLTGVFACEMTDASSGCLLNLHTREFDQKIFDALGIGGLRRLMPPCLESTDVSGYVTEEAAKRTGLAEGTPVAGGYFDIDAGALASGVLGPDMLCLIAGTWSINEYLRAEANTDYDKNCNTVTLSFLPGYFLVEDSSPTSASNFDWYVRTFLETGPSGGSSGRAVPAVRPGAGALFYHGQRHYFRALPVRVQFQPRRQGSVFQPDQLPQFKSCAAGRLRRRGLQHDVPREESAQAGDGLPHRAAVRRRCQEPGVGPDDGGYPADAHRGIKERPDQRPGRGHGRGGCLRRLRLPGGRGGTHGADRRGV